MMRGDVCKRLLVYEGMIVGASDVSAEVVDEWTEW